MKISINTRHVDIKDNPHIKGYATLKFDDKYVLEAVKIVENKETQELFVALPSIPVDPEKNNGVERKEIFHPITEGGRIGLSKAVLKQFADAEKDGKSYTYDIGDKMSFEPSATAKNFRSAHNNGNNAVAFGSVKFGNDYVCDYVSIKNKIDGTDVYIDTPNRKVKDPEHEGEMKYAPYFHPITTEAAAEFKAVCVKAFSDYKAEKERSYDWGDGIEETRAVSQQKAVAADNSQEIGGLDMSEFEDTSEFEELDLTASNGISR
ncbi:MAG: SpoVG family protein [Ruminococcus sp.]|nr:SpoVG family protein [Ruminococcus sp.]